MIDIYIYCYFSFIQGFASRAQCFIDQYGNFTVPELVDIVGEADAHVRGPLKKILADIPAKGGGGEPLSLTFLLICSLRPGGGLKALADMSAKTTVFFLTIREDTKKCFFTSLTKILKQKWHKPLSPRGEGIPKVVRPLKKTFCVCLCVFEDDQKKN